MERGRLRDARMASALMDALPPEVTGVGLALPEDTPFDQWVELGERLGRANRLSGWLIGDWLNFGERKYGETYSQGMDATGLSYQALADYAWVAGKFDLSLRKENLSITHHKHVAALPTEEQQEWLDCAVAEEWSAADLRKAIKGDPPLPSIEDLMQRITRCVESSADCWPEDANQRLDRFLINLGKQYATDTKLRFNLIRYPGAKGKLAKIVQRHMPDFAAGPAFSQGAEIDYREPFFGSGAVGLRLMAHALSPENSCVRLNDLDQSMAALWTAIRDEPNELIALVKGFEPNLASFNQFRSEDGLTGVQGAFQKLALHQMSFSGCGYMGGPIGGTEGSQKNPIGCRWNAGGIMQSIRSIHALMAQFSRCLITAVPWQDVVADAGENCFMYLDPPYYDKGGVLYRHSMNDADHAELANELKGSKADWVLSYDDHPKIHELYSWAKIERISVVYSVETRVREKTHELVITPGH